MSDSGPYSDRLLWALLVTSPRRARLAHSLPERDVERRHPGVPEGAAHYAPRWTHATGVILETSVWRYGNALFLTGATTNASPAAFRDELRGRGLHMRAAMAKDGLWRAFNVPIEAKIIVAPEELGTADLPAHDDYALFSIGGELEAEGEMLYQHALAKLDQAIRHNWPNWQDAGMQVLE